MKVLTSSSDIRRFLFLAAMITALFMPSGTNANEGLVVNKPFVRDQLAYANGFREAVLFINDRIQRGNLDIDLLSDLAANKNNSLNDLISAKTHIYRQKLIDLNPDHPEVKKLE